MEVWTPIKDGWHEDKAQYEQRTFHVAGDKLRVDERLPLVLGPNVRVCELVNQPDAPAAGVLTDEVREAIRVLLMDTNIWKPYIKEAYLKVSYWLDGLVEQGASDASK